MDFTGRGSVMPSFTNSGRISSAGCSLVSLTMRRIAAVVRSRRGRTFGKDIGHSLAVGFGASPVVIEDAPIS
ncbi:hypothetical protein Cba03nite_08180 [Catellatospora bangladeshensis]|uniref:Uncharacterized protein n=1 Tax=Catellatospora bangladeshensis TaxID=310355 RepID=A0A8J3JB99_9ACTN|nr:hypothetical protein Cba03nite_08180 [Catellatospora bangladeshensis]